MKRPDQVDLPDRVRQQIQAANARGGGPVLASAGQGRSGGARAGRVARAKGEQAEAQVLAACERYAAEGRAWITKRPTPVKPIGATRNGAFRAVWLAKAGCDFVGVLGDGRGLVMELKTSSGPSLPLERHSMPVLGKAQADELALVHRLGGLALVLVRLVVTRRGRPSPVWLRLDWPGWLAAVTEAHDEGAASLSLQRLLDAGEAVTVDAGRWLVGLT